MPPAALAANPVVRPGTRVECLAEDYPAMPSNGTRPVYVTGLGRVRYCKTCGQPEDQCRCRKAPARSAGPAALAPRDGVVRLFRERAGRKGRGVTLVVGLPDDAALLRELATSLKKLCACGGTLRGDVIELQGDVREIVLPRLESLGYRVKLAGG